MRVKLDCANFLWIVRTFERKVVVEGLYGSYMARKPSWIVRTSYGLCEL